MKFKLGDKVRAIADNYYYTCKSSEWEGIVTHVRNDGSFDAVTTKYIDSIETGEECHNLNPEYFELITPETIIIASDGKTTTAWLKQGKKTVKTAIAKCSPEDEFNLEIGAKLALDRLFEQEPKKEELKYKVGDRVRIVKKKIGENWNPEGAMDKWLGQTMTIKSVREIGMRCYKMKEDDELWCWYPWMIEGLAKQLVINSSGYWCGIVGTPTGLKDISGKDLFVGDIVRVGTDNTMRLVYMVEPLKDEFQPSGCGFGWKKNGADVNGWKVEKLVDWIECKSGDKLGNCRIEEK